MADETTGGANAGGSNTGGAPAAGGGTVTDTGTAESPNPSLDAPNNAPDANPPAAGQEPRIVKPIDEVQREVDDKGNTTAVRSQASAGQLVKDGIVGAPDGFGAGLEGGAGQTAPADTTEEPDEESEAEKGAKKARRKMSESKGDDKK